MKTKIRFRIPIFKENRYGDLEYWNHEFTTSIDLPKWIPYEDREETKDEEYKEYECEKVRQKLLRREYENKAPRGTLWRGFVETVDIVDGIEVWELGS